MNKKEFLEKFSDEVLQLEGVIHENTDLLTLSEWDSLAQITTVAFLQKEFNFVVKVADVSGFKTVSDILQKVNIND